MVNATENNTRVLLLKYKFKISSGDNIKDVTCLLCKNLMIDAFQTYCGCQYCRLCIVDYLSSGERFCCGGKEECKDEYLVLEKNVVGSAFLNRKISKTKVKCPNKSCVHIGELSQMEGHMLVCIKEEMECPYSPLGSVTEEKTNDEMPTPLQSEALTQTHILIDLIHNLRNEVGSLKSKFEENEIRIAALEEDSRQKEETRQSEVIKTKRRKTDTLSAIGALESDLPSSASVRNDTFAGIGISSLHIFHNLQQERPLGNGSSSQTPTGVRPDKDNVKEIMHSDTESSPDDIFNTDNSFTDKWTQSNSLCYIPHRNLDNIFTTFHYTPLPDCDVVLHGSDLLCLNYSQRLNDNIISFYLNFIRYEVMSEDQRRRTHLFNIFFANKLDGTPSTADEDTPESRHARVAKWTKKVDIFDKDFLIIPFIEDSHWFVAIVCFPWMAGMISYDKLLSSDYIETLCDIPANESEFATTTRQNRVNHLRDEQGVDPKPCILLFDSLQYKSRASYVSRIREYLKTEWDRKRLVRDGPLVFDKSTMRGFNPQVPQQDNNIDDGIFVLVYVEKFFAQPLKVFTKEFFQCSMTRWFSHETVGCMRSMIQKMILRKADEQMAGLVKTDGDSEESN